MPELSTVPQELNNIHKANSRDHKRVRNAFTMPTLNQGLSHTQWSTPHFWNKCPVKQ